MASLLTRQNNAWIPTQSVVSQVSGKMQNTNGYVWNNNRWELFTGFSVAFPMNTVNTKNGYGVIGYNFDNGSAIIADGWNVKEENLISGTTKIIASFSTTVTNYIEKLKYDSGGGVWVHNQGNGYQLTRHNGSGSTSALVNLPRSASRSETIDYYIAGTTTNNAPAVYVWGGCNDNNSGYTSVDYRLYVYNATGSIVKTFGASGADATRLLNATYYGERVKEVDPWTIEHIYKAPLGIYATNDVYICKQSRIETVNLNSDDYTYFYNFNQVMPNDTNNYLYIRLRGSLFVHGVRVENGVPYLYVGDLRMKRIQKINCNTMTIVNYYTVPTDAIRIDTISIKSGYASDGEYFYVTYRTGTEENPTYRCLRYKYDTQTPIDNVVIHSNNNHPYSAVYDASRRLYYVEYYVGTNMGYPESVSVFKL